MDLTMPRMDGERPTDQLGEERRLTVCELGYEAAQEIRKIEASRNQAEGPSKGLNQRARIFAVTGLASPDDKRKAFACGMDG